MTIIAETLPDAFFDGDADTAVWNDFSTVVDSDLHHLPGADLAAILSAAQRVIGRMHAVQEQAIALLAVPGKPGTRPSSRPYWRRKTRPGHPPGTA